RRRTARDYQFGTAIGEGSYSTVYLAVDLYNNKTYAVKMLSKKHIVKEGKIKYVNIEKTTLHRLGVQHPGIVQLYYTFQDELSLFFVLDFAEYGELLSIISKFGSLLEHVLKFYMLQILDAVKFIHLKGVIHRDLKPENILVGYDFNLKITDFGAAKLLGEDEDGADEKITYDSVNDHPQHGRQERKGSFVGTAEYVPPELLKYNSCGFETDIWAIACILFQFFNGVPPFKGTTEYLTFEKIINVNYSYREQVPLVVKEIIDKILVFEPLKRPTIPQIQAMPWFKNVPWDNREYIWNRKVPRFEPYTHTNSTITSPPHLKTGANRNYNKSNSNYQLHSQILKFDNLVPSFDSKSLYVPATRLKKGFLPQSAAYHQSSQNISNSSNIPPPMKNEVGQFIQESHYSTPPPQVRGQFTQESHYNTPPPQVRGQFAQDFNYNTPPPQVRGQFRQKQNQSPFKQMPLDLHRSDFHISSNMPKKPPSMQIRQSPQVAQDQTPQQSNSYIAAQQATASLAPLERSLEDSKISDKPASPDFKNLRTNTAFASFQKPSSTKANIPTKTLSSVPDQSHVSSRQHTKALPTNPTKQPNPRSREPVIVTIKEITPFLDPDEKIIKLDCVLKLILSNKLIDRKPGSLDDAIIEELIETHQSILDERMTPVIACVSNKAKVFLIDGNLDVMRVDLTANKGGDYLMYDYEFESVIVDDDDNNFTSKESEEVFGYLILELIKEGGDLIFLKRLNEAEKSKYTTSIKVIGSNGAVMKIGSNFGWIDCLIWAKEMVDKNLRGRVVQELSNKILPPERQPSPFKKSSSPNPSRSSSTSNSEQGSSDSKTAYNKFAYAAAAAAHR
ncbi:Pkinase-domain-containing protein, partial [Metschnikowia bicuspidata var. bicuspidata NRRL YB-4993]